VAAGNGEVVVIARVTGKVNEPVAVLLLASVTFTVKVEVTAAGSGTPDSTPAAVRFSPGGGEPAVIDHV
jgi:hypothetical protein